MLVLLLFIGISNFLPIYHAFNSKNHQCLISYFYKQNKNYEKESYIISQMSFFRNKLEYYGEDIPFEFLKNNKEKFEEIVEILLKLVD